MHLEFLVHQLLEGLFLDHQVLAYHRHRHRPEVVLRPKRILLQKVQKVQLLE
jgi:hypothetical protein